MSLTPSKRWKNFLTVTWNATVLDGIKSITLDSQIQLLTDMGDNDLFPTFMVQSFQNPVFTLSTTDAMALFASVGTGTPAVFLFDLPDAKNAIATGGGGYSFTTNNLSLFGSSSRKGDYNQYWTQDLTVNTCSIDGATNPVAVAAL